MAMKKQDRKENYVKVIKLMLLNKNKEAYNELVGMCGTDTGLFVLAPYDENIEKNSKESKE